jgi:hypothetical protein
MDQEEYAVWLADQDGEAKKRVFNLKYSKAGYVGSAVISARFYLLKFWSVKLLI